MRISDWSSDVCSSDLAFGQRNGVETAAVRVARLRQESRAAEQQEERAQVVDLLGIAACKQVGVDAGDAAQFGQVELQEFFRTRTRALPVQPPLAAVGQDAPLHRLVRSEEHTSELQSLMRISYAVFCLKKNN